MLKTYIFNEPNKSWVEENTSLLYHDLCAILDEERKIIYLWNGPKSSKERFNRGYKLLENLMSNYPHIHFQLSILEKEIPDYVQNKLDLMLKKINQEDEREHQKFTRFITIRLYLIFLIISLILPIFSALNLASSLFWTNIGNNFEVSADLYRNWLYVSYIVILISLISFIIITAIGIFEIEHQAIVFSLLGVIICSGIAFYLQQGIFLFLFQEGSTASIYYIKQSDIFIFLIVIIIGIIIFELPNAKKLISFIKAYRKYIF